MLRWILATISLASLASTATAQMTGFCLPGTGGVIPCPCANPPITTGAGCDNFGPLPPGGSGGALLTSTGTATTSTATTFQFVISGEQGTVTVLFCGTTSLAVGVPFGAGVRCVGGQLMRLYLKTGLIAAGGTMSAPVAGDRSISNQAVFLFPGNPLVAGATRFYQAYYRDPTQSNPGGSCPTNDTFNITGGVAVTWGP